MQWTDLAQRGQDQTEHRGAGPCGILLRFEALGGDRLAVRQHKLGAVLEQLCYLSAHPPERCHHVRLGRTRPRSG
eukprot:3105789-Rhodomonas_salina.2